MHRLTTAVFSATFCFSLFLLAGCEDPKKQIAQLEEEKRALGDQLLEATQDRDRAQAEATELRQRNSQLENALAQAKQAPPPPPPAEALKFVGALSTTDLGRANKPELSAKAKAELDAIAVAVKTDYADKHIYVVGHTDNDPIRRTKWKDNLELSCQRAMAVVRYLISKGIDPAQIFASGAGEYDPLAPNDNKANKAKNRRVEIYAGPKPTR